MDFVKRLRAFDLGTLPLELDLCESSEKVIMYDEATVERGAQCVLPLYHWCAHVLTFLQRMRQREEVRPLLLVAFACCAADRLDSVHFR